MFCESVGAECRLESKDPSTFDPASLEILDRLAKIEDVLGNSETVSTDPACDVGFSAARAINSLNEQSTQLKSGC